MGWAGPWIEDAWLRAFRRFTHHRASTGALLARAAELASRPGFSGAADAATYTLFECAAPFAPTGEFAHFLAEARRGAPRCVACAVGLSAVEQLHRAPAGEGGYVCAGAAPAAAAGPRALFQLFLSIPYDAELFHPFVPLFVPWEALNFAAAVAGAAAAAARVGHTPPAGLPPDYAGAAAAEPRLLGTPAELVPRLAALLRELLRPDVHYVTVAQRPAGPWLNTEFIAPLANTLVLSAGGNGHVPLPLLARELPRLPLRGSREPRAPHPFERAAVPPFGAADPPLTFFGSDRDGTRAAALRTIAAEQPGRFRLGGRLPNDPALWVPPFANATLAFAPRGTGATSFRLFEALQLGVPPVYVFEGAPWLPYLHPASALGVGFVGPPAAGAANPPPPARPADCSAPTGRPARGCFAWDRLAHAVELASLQGWARHLLPGVLDEGGRAAWEGMREEMGRVRESHFTYEGVVRHIARWLEDPADAELYCSVAVRPEHTVF